jgi:hypothetical protein
MVFLAWAFPFLLLTWTCWEDFLVRFRTAGWTALFTPSVFLMTFGYLLLAAKIQELPNVKHQWQRLTSHGATEPERRGILVQTIRQYTRPGERVAVIHPDGHWATLEAGVENVFPFTCPGSLILRSQLDRVAQAVQSNRVQFLFGFIHPELAPWLLKRGYRPIRDVDHWEVWQRVEDRCVLSP